MPDIPADTSTTANISVGDVVTGQLEVDNDHDWYRVTLSAGQSIKVTLVGSGSAPVADTYLFLRDSSGNVLSFNDDTAGTLSSKITFTATTAGTYYIDAGAWDPISVEPPANGQDPVITGGYTLSVQSFAPPPVVSNDTIAQELVSGWWGAQGTAAHHWNVKQGGTITFNIEGLASNPAAQNLALAALAEWSDIIGVNFQRVTTTAGQITFDQVGTGMDAYTEDVIGGFGQTVSASVHITSQWVSTYGTGLNSYSFQTYVHEIGHALGLGHAGNYNGDADYSTDSLFANDSWATSIMSYFSNNDNGYFQQQGFSDVFALTPMSADIVAMQQMYGLSTTTRTGDTTYGFNSNAGRDVFNASLYANVAYTVFDSGGNDTLDYSGFNQSQKINLNAETFSNVGGYTGNVSIARGTIIENAIGGGGYDILIGNDAANRLSGNAGIDTIDGGAGDDTLTGGAGFDTLTGGAGSDTFRDTKSGLSGDTITDFGAGDKIILTDATLAGFTSTLSNNTLTYSGGTITFSSNVSGTFTATAAAGGGVQLIMRTAHEVNNDFNGDGISDVLWRSDAGAMQEWLGNRNGSYSYNATLGVVSLSTSQHIVATDDFNGDGRSDILWRNDAGTLSEWIAQANGSFTTSSATYQVATSTHFAIAGDFNGDGRADVLWQDNNGAITEWLGQSDGSLTPNSLANRSVTNGWHAVESGDFNGDGRADVLWSNDSGATLTWLGQTNGTFVNAAATYQMPSAWHAVGAGDFNGDGLVDALWRNDSTGGTIEWLGQSNGSFAFNSAANSNLDPSWHVAEVGDFNGDGRDDIMWRNDSGSATSWIGQLDGSFSPSGASYAMPNNWHLQDHMFF